MWLSVSVNAHTYRLSDNSVIEFLNDVEEGRGEMCIRDRAYSLCCKPFFVFSFSVPFVVFAGYANIVQTVKMYYK